MSTKPDQVEASESQEREVIDVIEVPPAKSQSGGAEVDESDVTNDVEETAPAEESTADVETDIDVDPEGGSDLETTKEAHVVDGEDEDDIESETGGQTEQVEEDDAGTSTKTEPPAHFQWAVTGGTLKSVLSTIGTIVEETRIHIGEDGLRMRAVDPANVAMDDIDVVAAAFEAYDATPGVIAVDLDRFTDIVKLAGKDDLVQVSLDEETRKLNIHIDGLEFTMACLAPDSVHSGQAPDRWNTRSLGI